MCQACWCLSNISTYILLRLENYGYSTLYRLSPRFYLVHPESWHHLVMKPMRVINIRWLWTYCCMFVCSGKRARVNVFGQIFNVFFCFDKNIKICTGYHYISSCGHIGSLCHFYRIQIYFKYISVFNLTACGRLFMFNEVIVETFKHT